MQNVKDEGPSTPSDDVWYPQQVTKATHGRTVAFVVAATRAGNTQQSGLWAGALDASPVRLTEEIPATNLAIHEGESDGSGRLLYAVTKEGRGECVIYELATGEQSRVNVAGVPETVAWSRDGAPLILVAEPGADTASLTSGTPLLSDVPLARSNRAPIGWRRVWRVNEATATLEPVSPANVSVWEFIAMDAGRVLAIASTDPSEAGWYQSALSLFGPSQGEREEIYRGTWQMTSPSVSPDGNHVAFVEGWTSDRGLGNGRVRCVRLDDGTVFDLDVELGTDVTWLEWREDDRLWFAGWWGLDMSWGWVGSPFTGASEVSMHAGNGSISVSRWRPQVVATSAGAAITVHSTSHEPPEVCILDGEELTRWSHLNAGVSRERCHDVKEVRWQHEGVSLEGLLMTPNASPGPFPLVVDIHGGPSVSYHHSWDALWAETLCAEGYAVFMPNPYGGPGRGEAFARMNLGDPAGVEFDQILAGVHHLGAGNEIAVERCAVLGASYGGYLAAWAVAHGEVFRGGIVIAGISNLQSCWATANNAPFYEFLCAGTPNQHSDLYVARSPVNFVSPHSLPALILHGELDQCVSVGQARELFATLTSVNVHAELVVYPGEGHQVHRIEYVRDQRRRILEFLRDLM